VAYTSFLSVNESLFSVHRSLLTYSAGLRYSGSVYWGAHVAYTSFLSVSRSLLTYLAGLRYSGSGYCGACMCCYTS